MRRSTRRSLNAFTDGVIGDLLYTRVYFNTGAIWVRPRLPDYSEMKYQVRNWYHFVWLSGDHIVEQHVHDIDVGNWMANAHPIQAGGLWAGRQVRNGAESEIYDHHAVSLRIRRSTARS